MHKRCAIFTPTQRPGIDVSLASVARQDTFAEILWIVADELYDDRRYVLRNLATDYQDQFELKHFYAPKDPGKVRNLAKVYNIGMEIAREWGADLFVSLQDYIWAPPSGVQRFLDLDERGDAGGIYTGLTHISNDPLPEDVYDDRGMYTIFFEEFTSMPTDIGWIDVREELTAPALRYCSPIEWETNWAAIGRRALYDPALYFDEAFDNAVAYENQDFAHRANQLSYKIVIDGLNQACSLPHKKYFPDEWAYEEPLTITNKELSESRWGS